jgi:hypothetical protein
MEVSPFNERDITVSPCVIGCQFNMLDQCRGLVKPIHLVLFVWVSCQFLDFLLDFPRGDNLK